jgi:hypothetical protein
VRIDEDVQKFASRGIRGLIVSVVLLTCYTCWTENAAGNPLPDARVFELVTPTENDNADVHVPLALNFEEGEGTPGEGAPTTLPFQVAETGNSIAYVADPTTNGFGRGGNGFGNQYIAHRVGGGEWSQANVQPRGLISTYFRAFSPDLGVGIIVSGGEARAPLPPLSPDAPSEGYNTLYACSGQGGLCGVPGIEEEPAEPYKPLYGKPRHRAPQEFGTNEVNHPVFVAGAGTATNGAVFAGGSPDFSSLLFEANDSFPGVEGAFGREVDEDVAGEIASKENNDYLYDLHGGKLSVVDVLPGPSEHVSGGATFGAPPFEGRPARDQPDFSNVISADGRRVFWTDLRTGRVYVRVDEAVTVQISEGSARYWTSAADGRYAFYSEAGGLYRFNLEPTAYDNERETLADSSAGVLGVIGASENGEDVYFVAENVLTSENNAEGIAPEEGAPNLYFAHRGNVPIYIGTLSAEDGHAIEPFNKALFSGKGEYGDWLPGAGQRTAEVAPTGSSVVFMSDRPLAVEGYPHGYTNEGLEEVYLYDAVSNKLFCVSCNVNAESPSSSESGAAAFLPIGWNAIVSPRWLSDNGNRVFFDSAIPLVSKDTNGKQDVYEWEREGTGSCSLGSGVDGGCISMLSAGISESASWFLGASSDGNDLFIATRARLAGEDQNEAFDVYDAAVGGITRPSNIVNCIATSCQGVPAPPPVFETPSSLTFNGMGNNLAETYRRYRQTRINGKHHKGHLTRRQKYARVMRACSRFRGHPRTMCERIARKYLKVAKRFPVGRHVRGGRGR